MLTVKRREVKNVFVRLRRKLVSIEHTLIRNRISNDDNKTIPEVLDASPTKYISWGRKNSTHMTTVAARHYKLNLVEEKETSLNGDQKQENFN